MLLPCVYACRPGKGVHAAARAVQHHLQRAPWYVQIDVDGYFPSIRHDLLLALLARRFKGRQGLDLFARILATGASMGGSGHSVAGRGLPIGALTSQYFANSFLDPADRHLAASASVCGQVRYMDDLVWWCADLPSARATLAGMRDFLATQLDLAIKPNARIGRSQDGIAWCGFRIRQDVILPSRRKLRRWQRWMEAIYHAEQAGCPIDQVQRACGHALAILAHSHSLPLRQAWCARHFAL